MIYIKINKLIGISCFDKKCIIFILFFFCHAFGAQIYISPDAELNFSKGTIVIINDNYSEGSKILEDRHQVIVSKSSTVSNYKNSKNRKSTNRKLSKKNYSSSSPKLPKSIKSKKAPFKFSPISTSEYFSNDYVRSHFIISNINFHYLKFYIRQESFILTYCTCDRKKINFFDEYLSLYRIYSNHLFARPPPNFNV
ncbi:hypothetical protein IO90_10625 [Chryseobacterium sp. FH1]|nr:hypothetical protein IO90_10625 [Chryseobacterium sp. FH1]